MSLNIRESEYFGIFIDILGFQEMAGDRRKIQNYFLFIEAIDHLREYNDIHINEISDSIFIYCELGTDRSFQNIRKIIFQVQRLQAMFLTSDIQIRGGADIGKLYIHEQKNKRIKRSNGQLLVNCYNIENKVSKWGRIVISRKAINNLKQYYDNDAVMQIEFRLWFDTCDDGEVIIDFIEEIVRLARTKMEGHNLGQIALTNLTRFSKIHLKPNEERKHLFSKSKSIYDYYNSKKIGVEKSNI